MRHLILDTDIGDDVDDAFALALLLRLPQANLTAVTTVHGAVEARAHIALKMVAAACREDVPVYVGSPGRGDRSRPLAYGGWASDWSDTQPAAGDAASFIVSCVMDSPPGTVTLLAVGPLSNVALALRQEPRVAERLRRLVIMGGSVRVGYGPGSPPCPEYNIACDPAAAKVVFESGAPLLVAPLDATMMLQPSREQLEALAGSPAPLARALQECLTLWGRGVPTLFDPMAAACALDDPGLRFVETERMHLEVTDNGLTVERRGLPPNAEVATSARAQDFLNWYFDALLRA